ncbi:MAG: L,D-transpeptidase family protein [Candidatus Omnitrophica bacterium]|nr:L,D-transpeptidase family protein [Candidatus Omnitrophota bacterium]
MGHLQFMMRVFSTLTGWIVLGCLAMAAPSWAAETPKTSKPKTTAASSETGSSAKLELLRKTLKEIRTLKRRGQYLEASEKYALILDEIRLSTQDRKKITHDYEKLNTQLLFSRTATPGTTLHNVVEGDSLYTIAKKYGTTSALIRRMNGLTKDVIYPGMKLKAVTGKFYVRVDKSQNTLRLFLDETPIKTYLVATGKANSTPTGEFTVKDKLVDPTWYKSGAIIEPGSPDNHLGTRWLGFDLPGYGIHGTTEPQLIGKQVSHGCVRMRNEDVEELYDILPQGTKVAITD